MGISEQVVQNSGSVLGGAGAREVKNIQDAHLKSNRLGIPLLMMADIIHGFKTIFPVPLAIGCSWDMELAEKSAQIAAKEAAVSGVHVTFAPMVDLVRDPRWGRVMETTGEDPVLNSAFARAFVRGFQGDDVANDLDRVAACVKHFAAYGAPEGGRDYNTVDMSERQLRESYLPAYLSALDEGCEMVMTAFNTVDGVPATGNKRLMRELLRDEWGFDGVIISDWGAVKEAIPHGVAEDEAGAALRAIEAGVDIEMMTACYAKHLKQLIEDGVVSEALVDEAALRILRLKEKLGLFENPYRAADETQEASVILCTEHRQAARELATKSAVLLKNNGLLPLEPTSALHSSGQAVASPQQANANKQKIALIGPFADCGDLMGPWSWQGSSDDVVTLYEGIKAKVGADALIVASGCDIESGSEEQLQEAVQAAQQADVIVLALGEHSLMSGEAKCRADIRLPHAQLELLSQLNQLQKPMAAVLINGRPLDLHGVVEPVDALIEAWYPGTEGGNAIADLLFGDANPSGKLSMSFPYSVGQVPVYYNHFNTGRPKVEPVEEYVSKYLDIPNDPLFSFGYGLSYTTFSYGPLSLSSQTMASSETITASVEVTNSGDVAGEEVVQFYIRDLVGEVVRPVNELKDFQKVALQPGETKKIQFTITEEMLRYHHSDLQFCSDAGTFVASVGPNSTELKSVEFELTK